MTLSTPTLPRVGAEEVDDELAEDKDAREELEEELDVQEEQDDDAADDVENEVDDSGVAGGADDDKKSTYVHSPVVVPPAFALEATEILRVSPDHYKYPHVLYHVCVIPLMTDQVWPREFQPTAARGRICHEPQETPSGHRGHRRR